jgi:hypothetical protein
MSSYKTLAAGDTKITKSTLNQLVDVIQEDISGSFTRRTYQVFVTGGVGPGVTSSLFQTVYDQDFTLQTANPVFDMTVGLFVSGATVASCTPTVDSAGKMLFPSTSLMMREKIDIYKQYAKNLLGSADSYFTSPFDSTDVVNRIDNALFISFKRLFSRDGIKKETFAFRFASTASITNRDNSGQPRGTTLDVTSESTPVIYTDIGAATSTRRTFGGDVANIVNASNTNSKVGLIFYDQGTVVLDLKKIISGTQHVSGVIDAMNANRPDAVDGAGGILPVGTMVIGKGASSETKYIPDFLTSGSIDDIVDHIATTRFSSGSLTAMTFQNATQINSTLFFCRVSADEFNYSTNPTYTDSNGRIRVIDVGQETNQRSFTFPTTIGLHNGQGDLLAVAKLSRPIEKNDERDITFRVRLDF